MIQNIHPFPARMAPELALQTLEIFPKGSIVLDPMAGSGMVLKQACAVGHKPIGFDMDPLAVLMSSVWTTHVDDLCIVKKYEQIINFAKNLSNEDVSLPWIDNDLETSAFIRYWFGENQILDLRKIAFSLYHHEMASIGDEEIKSLNVIKVALSRIIITKEQCASLARDTSHSRPHRVTMESSYSVFDGLEKSIKMVRKRLHGSATNEEACISLGDARDIRLRDNCVDVILTSPPYLNAIDYMRGHRMSLVWLGFKISDLRKVRSNSIGAERAPDFDVKAEEVIKAFGNITPLPNRYHAMIRRYAGDLLSVMSEVKRVLVPRGKATFVVGNSCLKGVFIKNSDALIQAGMVNGLHLASTYERDLPQQSRYLPTSTGSALQKRMRTETIITFSS